VIRNFATRDTERLHRGEYIRRWGLALQRAARRKLRVLDAAMTLEDLRGVPGLGLEKLAKDRAGQWSIRINLQWRVCFRWEPEGPHAVEITDYH
jgi:proteic killer suppression protein